MNNSIKVFDDAWNAYLNKAYFTAEKLGSTYLISIINIHSKVNHKWITGEETHSFNESQYQKIKAKYELQ